MKNVFKKSTMLLLFLIFVWGASWPIYKIALPFTPPILFAGMRATLGGVFLAIILYNKRDKIKWRENWRFYSISALLNTTLFFGIQTVGLNFLPGGLFSILVYFQPVLLGLFAWIWLGEFMTPGKIIGLLIGFIGIAIVSLDGLTFHVSVIGVVLGLMTAIFWALGVIYVKKVSQQVNAFWMVSMQCIIGGFVLIIFGGIFEDFSDIVWNSEYVGALSFGSILGIPLAQLVYYKLIREGEASKVGSFTFMVPIIAVILGAVFLDEPVTYLLVLGLIMVGLSIFIVNYRSKKKLIDYKKIS
ncbi:DMT family transporter [Psychrobacillus sp. NPDC096623]|uniref:DMT family transporter n=1 Tax=Psychrobacillus sp. NPDC096623 TaxID=3364492 RepID=UPI0038168C7B